MKCMIIYSLHEIVEANVGDYVVVLVSGKTRILKYIARVDEFMGKITKVYFCKKLIAKLFREITIQHPLL